MKTMPNKKVLLFHYYSRTKQVLKKNSVSPHITHHFRVKRQVHFTPAASLPLALQQQSTLYISFNDNSDAATVKIRLSEMCDTLHMGSGCSFKDELKLLETQLPSLSPFEMRLEIQHKWLFLKSQLWEEVRGGQGQVIGRDNGTFISLLVLCTFNLFVHNKVSVWPLIFTTGLCVRSQKEKNLVIRLKAVFSKNLLNY